MRMPAQGAGGKTGRLVWLILAVRLAYTLLLPAFVHFDPQEEYYDDLARNLVAGHGYVLEPGGPPNFHRPPGYPLLLAGLFAVFGERLPVVFACHLAFDVLTVLVVFRVAGRLFGGAAARTTALLCALYPFSAYYNVTLLTETLFALLVALGLLFLTDAVLGRSRLNFLAAGAVFGAGVLTRFSLFHYVLSLPVAAFLLALFRAARRRVFFRHELPGYLMMVLVALAVLAPWTWRNDRAGAGFPVLGTGAGYNLWLGNHLASDGRDTDELAGARLQRLEQAVAQTTGPGGDPLAPQYEAAFARRALAEMRSHPAATARLMVRKLFRFWGSIFQPANRPLGWILLPVQAVLVALAVRGTVRSLYEGRRVWHVVWLIVYFNLLHAAVVSTYRYCVPVMPYVILLAVAGTPVLQRIPMLSRVLEATPEPGGTTPRGVEP